VKTIYLQKNERIVAVVPERVRGPGWSNTPTWVYIMDNNGGFRVECIQAEGMSQELMTLFAAGAVMCESLRQSIHVEQNK
jgi:hypothetical protein